MGNGLFLEGMKFVKVLFVIKAVFNNISKELFMY